MSFCGPDSDFLTNGRTGRLTGVGFLGLFLFLCLCHSGYTLVKRARSGSGARLPPLALLFPLLVFVLAASMVIQDYLDAEEDAPPVQHTGYFPPDGSVFTLPVIYIGVDPVALHAKDDYAKDINLRYLCSETGSEFKWQGKTYTVYASSDCAVEEAEQDAKTRDVNEIVKVKTSGNTKPSGRMSLKFGFDDKIRLAEAHKFAGKKYRLANGRHDSLRIRDIYFQDVWRRMNGNVAVDSGMACTSTHVFTSTMYLGIMPLCSDRNDRNAPARTLPDEPLWLAEVLPNEIEIEQSPETDKKVVGYKEVCRDQGVQAYPEVPLCPEFKKYVAQLESGDVVNVVDQFIFGEFTRDYDLYARSFFVHVNANGDLRYGPQWDCDACFQFDVSGYTGWDFRTFSKRKKPQAQHQWFKNVSKHAELIKYRIGELSSLMLSPKQIGDDLDDLAETVRADMRYEELAWTRHRTSAGRFFRMVYDNPDVAIGYYNDLMWSGFEHEFANMKRLTQARMCWIIHNIDDVATNSGPGLHAPLGWGVYFVWVAFAAFSVSLVLVVAHVVLCTCNRRGGASLSSEQEKWIPMESLMNNANW